jgi:hypothetical protein
MIIGLCGGAGTGKDAIADILVKNHGFVKVAFADPLKRICQDVYDFTDEQLWGPSAMRNAPDKRYLRGIRLGCGCLAEETQPCIDEPEAFWVTRLVELCDREHRRGESWYRGHIIRPGSVEHTRAPEYLTPRLALQRLGTEWGRHCYPLTWVNKALRIAERLKEGDCHYDARVGLRPISKIDAIGNDRWVTAKTDVVISDVRFENEIHPTKAAKGRVVRVTRDGAGLTAQAGAHVSETEQKYIPQSLFDLMFGNDGDSLLELEVAVAECLRALKTL